MTPRELTLHLATLDAERTLKRLRPPRADEGDGRQAFTVVVVALSGYKLLYSNLDRVSQDIDGREIDPNDEAVQIQTQWTRTSLEAPWTAREWFASRVVKGSTITPEYGIVAGPFPGRFGDGADREE